MSTLPAMPATVPVDEYCQSAQSCQGGAMFGQATEEYCACQSGEDVMSGAPTESRQN
jgi:hypothetical protein